MDGKKKSGGKRKKSYIGEGLAFQQKGKLTKGKSRELEIRRQQVLLNAKPLALQLTPSVKLGGGGANKTLKSGRPYNHGERTHNKKCWGRGCPSRTG